MEFLHFDIFSPLDFHQKLCFLGAKVLIILRNDLRKPHYMTLPELNADSYTALPVVGAWMSVSILDGETVITEGRFNEHRGGIFPHSPFVVMRT